MAAFWYFKLSYSFLKSKNPSVALERPFLVLNVAMTEKISGEDLVIPTKNITH